MGFFDQQLADFRDRLLGATVTQVYGPSQLSMEPAYAGYPHFHKGVDLVLQGGTKAPIRAPASGIVETAGWYNGFGNAAIIRAPNGYTYLMGHMSGLWTRQDGRTGGPQAGSPLLQVGQVVRAGDIVGFQGTTGASTGVHLHLQVMDPHGRPVDLGGNNVKAIFGSLYHILGFGGGMNLQSFQDPPDPSRLSFAPVPDPFPNSTGQYTPEETYPTEPGSPAPGGTPGGSSYPPAQLAGFGVPSLDLGAMLGSLIQAGPNLEKQIGPAIFLGILGLAFIFSGLRSLGKEQPVQTVVNVTGIAAAEKAASGAIKDTRKAATSAAVAAA